MIPRVILLSALSVWLAMTVHAANDFDVCKPYNLPQLARSGTALSPEAEYCLGFGYAAGQVLQRDLTQALRHYRRAADKGYPAAEAIMGLHYQKGLGVPTDLNEAISWYKKAAAHGHEGAKQNLASLQASPATSTPQPALPGQPLFEECKRLYKAGDKAGAVQPCRQAADAGNHWAQLQIGSQYEFGEGLPVNYTEAARWYAKSANQGNWVAQKNLGQLYENGQGVPENWVEAAKWYRKSAEQNYDHGQFALGRAYQFGMGVPQNRREAIVWFEKAATAGHGQAAYFARHLKGNNFIGFRNDAEHQLVIANKLRFALTFQEPVGLLFRNASERNAYLRNLRGEVDTSEAMTMWNIHKNEYEECKRSGRSYCPDPGPPPR